MTAIPNKLEDIKLVIAGLDNAGKTSSLIALRQKYNFYERIANLKPTIKIDYSSFKFLDKYTINLWDMGGQEKYRTIYVQNPVYFNATDYFYFLIDIRDELKIETAVHYLHEVLDIYREMNYKNEVVICFTKFDPKHRNNEEFAERAEMIKDLVLIQNKDMKFKFFTMSIYDISSISKAFSFSLNKLLNLETINSKLKAIVDQHNCDHIVLYSDKGLIISDYYHETMDSREFEERVSDKINEDLEFFQRIADEKVEIDERITFTKDRTEYVRKYEISTNKVNSTFYIGVLAPPKKISNIKNELETIQNELVNLYSLVES
ncbi:MAG: ADP-ribosylation factor-like protein [Promethearchaeota archaeon]